MRFQSPAVGVVEIDASLSPVEQGDSYAAMVGKSTWGFTEHPTRLAGVNEEGFAERFGAPTDDTYLTHFVAADFLSYCSKMYFTRVVGKNAKNAVPKGKSPVLVKNPSEYEIANLSGLSFIAKSAGSKGNGLIVDVADSEKFKTWEFANQFQFPPQAGEYSVVVADGSGQFTGRGATKQTERLSVLGRVSGGVRQTEQVTFTGSAVGGVKQEEVIVVVGSESTGTTLIVDGVSVTLEVGDGDTVVATKIAQAFVAKTSAYSAARAVGNKVYVTFAVSGSRPKIVSTTGSGMAITSSISRVGSDVFTAIINKVSVTLRQGDIASLVAVKFKEAVDLQNRIYAHSDITSNSVTYTYIAYGANTVTASQTIAGLTVATTATTAGVNTVSVSVFDNAVALVDGDSAVVVAEKIAVALKGDVKFTDVYDNIVVDRGSVLYTTKTTGRAELKATPDADKGLQFSVDTKTTGQFGSVLEKYELLSNVKGSAMPDGTQLYFVDALNLRSAYIWVGDTAMQLTAGSTILDGGVDDYNTNTTGEVQRYANTEEFDIAHIISGAVSVAEQKTCIDVAEQRMDCFAYASPMFGDVVNNPRNELDSVCDWREIELARDSTYLKLDSGWALVYDKYNETKRWIPTCGGTAGLRALVATNQEPWIPAAGHENGRYRNYLRLAWSPNKAERDELFKRAVNPVVSFPTDGILCYGDKTGTSRPSAFSGENVRQAFIEAEKTLGNFARFYLFKLNNEFTRAQFVNAVRPYLRNMVARGAFEDAKLIVDERNNSSYVREQGKLVGTILIKPLYSIRFIELQFVASGAGLSFEELEKSMFG